MAGAEMMIYPVRITPSHVRMSMEMPAPHEMSRAEKIADTKRLLDMYNHDLANDAMGEGSAMNAEDRKRAEETVAKLEKELEELERGA